MSKCMSLEKYALAFIDIPPTIQLVPQKHVVSILKDEDENTGRSPNSRVF